MYTALRKIHKDKDAEPSEFEESVAQVESSNFVFTCFGFYFSSHSLFLAVIFWFGEYQSGAEKWFEGPIHKFSSVRTGYVIAWWFRFYIFSLHMAIKFDHLSTYQSNGCGWEPKGCCYPCSIPLEESFPENSCEACEGTWEKIQWQGKS